MDTRNDGSWNMFVRLQIWLVILGWLNFRGRSRLILFSSVTFFFGFAVCQTKIPSIPNSCVKARSGASCKLSWYSLMIFARSGVFKRECKTAYNSSFPSAVAREKATFPPEIVDLLRGFLRDNDG